MHNKKADIRITSKYDGIDDNLLTIGASDEEVVAFKLVNSGQNSLVKFETGGEGIELRPGQEEMFGAHEGISFNVQFNLNWKNEDLRKSGDAGPLPPFDPSKDVLRKITLIEIYLKP